MKYGYVRDSLNKEKNIEKQKNILKEKMNTLEEENIIVENNGEELEKLLKRLKDGDVLFVTSIDRLGKGPGNISKVIDILIDKNITLYANETIVDLTDLEKIPQRLYAVG